MKGDFPTSPAPNSPTAVSYRKIWNACENFVEFGKFIPQLIAIEICASGQIHFSHFHKNLPQT
jgi:hypothetical protein